MHQISDTFFLVLKFLVKNIRFLECLLCVSQGNVYFFSLNFKIVLFLLEIMLFSLERGLVASVRLHDVGSEVWLVGSQLWDFNWILYCCPRVWIYSQKAKTLATIQFTTKTRQFKSVFIRIFISKNFFHNEGIFTLLNLTVFQLSDVTSRDGQPWCLRSFNTQKVSNFKSQNRLPRSRPRPSPKCSGVRYPIWFNSIFEFCKKMIHSILLCPRFNSKYY